MEQRHPTRSIDFKIIALLTVMFACVIALIILLFHDASVAESGMQSMLSSQAAMLHSSPSPVAKRAAVAPATKPVTPEEN